MQKITTVAGLKYAIQILEAEQADHGQLLKEQFRLTYDSIRPVNLLRGTLNDVASSPWLIENIIVNVLGLAGGYLSKRLVVGASGNRFRKLLGSVLQFGVTNLVSKHPDTIKSLRQSIFHHFFRKKESITS